MVVSVVIALREGLRALSPPIVSIFPRFLSSTRIGRLSHMDSVVVATPSLSFLSRDRYVHNVSHGCPGQNRLVAFSNGDDGLFRLELFQDDVLDVLFCRRLYG